MTSTTTTVSYPAIVGFTIAKLRKGRPQGQIADALDIGQSGYSKLERGVRVLSVTQLRVVAAELEVPEQRIYDLAAALREAVEAQPGHSVVDEKAREDDTAATTALLEQLWSELEVGQRTRRSGS